LIVPMQLGLQVLGALVLRAPLANRYDALDLESLELLASTCAIGLRNAQLFGEVQRLAITDALTGVYNRRHFLDLAHTELARANRSPAPLAMLMLDIDQFKRINDTYGHAVGDRALQSMVHCCRATLRTIDVLGRYGGEEFAVLLSGADEQQALMVAERLRQQIAEVPIPLGDREISITVSIGVAVRAEHSTLSLQTLLDYADKALYQAKSAGRNRVRLWSPPRLGV
ncbi:MAG TPA: sensor domain-containing diguanylate cyclase, partial [Roseiflexaceae bacterium]|nr:sensor domain-containing diguanylate cyclase [Roseiflexaceae bacterium]